MEHRIYDLDAAMAAARKPIDAGWSKRKKLLIGGSCVVLAAGVICGGVWAMQAYSPPPLPKTAQEAIAVMASARYKRMDAERREHYNAEAQRLFRALDEESRRALFRDEQTRQAMRAMMEERMDEMARKYARGEELQFPGGPGGPGGRGFGPGGPGQRPGADGQRAQRPPGQEMTQEEREKRMEEMRARANDRVSEQVSTGNAQSGGLRGEMMKRGAAARQGRGSR